MKNLCRGALALTMLFSSMLAIPVVKAQDIVSILIWKPLELQV